MSCNGHWWTSNLTTRIFCIRSSLTWLRSLGNVQRWRTCSRDPFESSTIQRDDQTLFFHVKSDRLLCVTWWISVIRISSIFCAVRDVHYLFFWVSRSLVKLSPSALGEISKFYRSTLNVDSRRRHEVRNFFCFHVLIITESRRNEMHRIVSLTKYETLDTFDMGVMMWPWPFEYGRLWTNRLWSQKVISRIGRLWPKPTLTKLTLAKTDVGQNRLWPILCVCLGAVLMECGFMSGLAVRWTPPPSDPPSAGPPSAGGATDLGPSELSRHAFVSKLGATELGPDRLKPDRLRPGIY